MYDQQGNAHVEVRDANRNTIFFMRLKGREMQEAKRFREELALLVVRLLNDSNESDTAFEVPLKSSAQNEPVAASNGNGEVIQASKKRGRPLGSKNR